MTSEEVSARVDGLLTNGSMFSLLEDLKKYTNKVVIFRPFPTVVGYSFQSDGILIEEILEQSSRILIGDHPGDVAASVVVWVSGKWIKPGPWVPKIKVWLGELFERVEAAKAEAERKRQEKEAALVAAWS